MTGRILWNGWSLRSPKELEKRLRYVSNHCAWNELLTSLQASSLEQSHALVTFGYLSMLICTLCLDDDIRSKVRRGMKGRSLYPLILTVEEFLHHFRTVEQVMVEDEASNNFTERFGQIVNQLREAEGVSEA